jgi:hypothetical protein
MPLGKREELKTIKINNTTHARLSILSDILECSISDVIDDLMVTAYPEVMQEAEKLLSRMEELRGVVEAKKQRQKTG